MSVIEPSEQNHIDSLLYLGANKWNNIVNGKTVITFSFLNDGDPDQSFTSEEREIVWEAFKAWEEVANIHFVEDTTGNGSIRIFIVPGRDAWLSGIGSSNPVMGLGAEMLKELKELEDKNLSKYSFGYYAILHEIGHALLLKHPGSYDSTGDVPPPPYLPPEQDNHQYSLMSYNGHPGSLAYPGTPMLFDIAAIQYLYGRNTSTRAGDFSYSWSSATPFIYTIWDGGDFDTDTIDASNQTRNAVINLEPGGFSSINGINNVAIAYRTIIENATGGTGSDNISGNIAPNLLIGGVGNDTIGGGRYRDNTSIDNDTLIGEEGDDLLYGGSGEDTLDGGSGNDFLQGDLSLSGSNGNDWLSGGDGDDYLDGRHSNDNLDGGSGTDTLDGGDDDDYLSGGDGNDSLDGGHGNNTLYGGNGDDSLKVKDGQNLLFGEGGNDTLIDGIGSDFLSGGDGNDNLYAGFGNDTVSGGTGDDTYFYIYEGDVVVEDADAGTDTVVTSWSSYTLGENIESLIRPGSEDINSFGNSLNNQLIGNRGKNYLDGGDGNDLLSGDSGSDTLSGGLGNDTLSGDTGYDQLYGGIGNDQYKIGSNDADLVIEYAGEGEDTVSSYVNYSLNANVEHLILVGDAANGYGNDLNNTIAGNTADNYLYGADGTDTLEGQEGNDYLYGQSGNDSLLGGFGEDWLLGDAGNDSLAGGMGKDWLIAGLGDDWIVGEQGKDRLIGGAGDDTLSGGIGKDWLTGDTGADQFLFSILEKKADIIKDFRVLDGDSIAISAQGFSKKLKIGKLSKNQFALGSVAEDRGDRFIYDSFTGKLLFDTDGTGRARAVTFARLSKGLSLTHNDINVVV